MSQHFWGPIDGNRFPNLGYLLKRTISLPRRKSQVAKPGPGRGEREGTERRGERGRTFLHVRVWPSLGLLIYVVGIPKGPCGRPPVLSPHRIPNRVQVNWSLQCQDGLVGKLLVVQARWPEFYPQNPHKTGCDGTCLEHQHYNGKWELKIEESPGGSQAKQRRGCRAAESGRDPVSPGGKRDQRTVSEVRSLALELQMVVSCLTDAEHQTQVLYKKGKNSQLISHLSSPSFNILLAYIHYR